MYIDTHCHLDFDKYSQDRDEVIKRAVSTGVEAIINVGTTLEGTKESIRLSREYPQLYASCGIHPHYAGDSGDGEILEIKSLAGSPRVVALGEVGLDHSSAGAPAGAQKAFLEKFLGMTKSLNLPYIFHNRDAHADILEVITGALGRPVRGVMHCFSGDYEFASRVLDTGMLISFTGNVTFNNASALRDVASKIPVEKMMFETDAPFLAPQAYRGKRNEPAWVRYIASEIAQLKKLTIEDVARITTLTARTFFSLGEPGTKSVIAYKIRSSLYLNITNRCTNNCSFCVRNFTDYVKGHNLRLEREPGTKEILEAVGDPLAYREIVFCGYGEPTIRLDVVKEVSAVLKGKGARVRIVTNGHGNLIHKRKIAPELSGLIDEVCVSVNVEDAAKYSRICRPEFGDGTFEAVKQFILDCKEAIPEVTITCLAMPDVDLSKCRDLAKTLGVNYRQREYNVVG